MSCVQFPRVLYKYNYNSDLQNDSTLLRTYLKSCISEYGSFPGLSFCSLILITMSPNIQWFLKIIISFPFFRIEEKSLNRSSSRLKEDTTWFGWCQLRIGFGSWISSNNWNGRRFCNRIRKRIYQETTSQDDQCQR